MDFSDVGTAYEKIEETLNTRLTIAREVLSRRTPQFSDMSTVKIMKDVQALEDALAGLEKINEILFL